MKIPRPYSLQSKFILGLIGSVLLVSALIITLLYYFMKNALDDEINTTAEIILQQVDAIQSYVRQNLRPKMYAILPDTFVVEAMSSSYISRAIMEGNSEQETEYFFRRVAVNARNAKFEANETETELLAYFRAHTDENLWKGYRKIGDKQVFIMARPVQFSAGCMTCHGNPSDAPKELIEKYGNRGFHHTLNGIDGIDLVGIPTKPYVTQSGDRMFFYIFSYLAVSALVLILTYLTFRQVVIVNFKTLTTHFRKNFSDQKGEELLRKVEHGDEIEEMIEGMQGLSQHLYETEKQLKQYNADLENEVTIRTDELRQESRNHKQDLDLFLNILSTLRHSQKGPQLWSAVLPLLARRFNLVSASYICTFSSNRTFSWPNEDTQHQLPADYIDMLTEPKVRIEGRSAYIPVGSTTDNIEGILYLERQTGDYFPDSKKEMLMAVGRQLGISVEYLAALDSILRQSRDLQTIVDGIKDPLFLIDRQKNMILANKAASILASEVQCNQTDNLLPYLFDYNVDKNSNISLRALCDQSHSLDILLDNGRSFTITSFPLSGKEFGAEKAIVAINESTEKKKMVEQVVRSEKMATVGKLAAGLAHELNNPMGVILCYAELLKKTIQEPQQQNDVDVVIKHTKQAQAVLLDLLNFARPKVATHRKTNISEVVESVTAVFQVQAAKKGVQLNFSGEQDTPPVQVEPQVVEHIVLNLLINALDAINTTDGQITVQVQYDALKHSVIMKVIDNGGGIEPQNLPLIFDPFFTTKEINEGTGLGLAIVYGYIDELGGEIEAFSSRNKGTVFEVTFPVQPVKEGDI